MTTHIVKIGDLFVCLGLEAARNGGIYTTEHRGLAYRCSLAQAKQIAANIAEGRQFDPWDEYYDDEDEEQRTQRAPYPEPPPRWRVRIERFEPECAVPA